LLPQIKISLLLNPVQTGAIFFLQLTRQITAKCNHLRASLVMLVSDFFPMKENKIKQEKNQQPKKNQAKIQE